MIAFFKQCQATNKAAGILKEIAKDMQPKERKMAQLPVARSRESSYRQHSSRKYHDYHRSNLCNRDDQIRLSSLRRLVPRLPLT
jgi:hypothetical protein